MSFLKISNKGEISPDALKLMGGTTKDGISSIGMFGTGNKYAIAFFLRNNIGIRIFSGVNEIIISTSKRVFRDKEFDVIYIDGNETSITTNTGHVQWKLWHAIREIYSNALDEGEGTIDFVENISPEEGDTHIYIDATPEIKKFYDNIDIYFTLFRKPIYEAPNGVKFYDAYGPTLNVYRKGIRCYDTSDKGIYDYNIDELQITENRTIGSDYPVSERVWNAISKCTNTRVIRKFILNCGDDAFFEHTLYDWYTFPSKWTSEFIDVFCSFRTCPNLLSGLLLPEERRETVIVPHMLYKAMLDVIPEDKLAERFKVSQAGMYNLQVPSPEQQSIIDKAVAQLKYMNFNVNYDIIVGAFSNPDTYGSVDEKFIILSNTCFERGMYTICKVIMHEQMHIESGKRDASRAFEDHILSSWLTYMSNHHSIQL